MTRATILSTCFGLVLASMTATLVAQESYVVSDGVSPQMPSSAEAFATSVEGKEFPVVDPGVGASCNRCSGVESSVNDVSIRCSCRGSSGRLLSGQRLATVKELVRREVPSGNQGLNMPYYTPQLYYYKRPYNTSHVRAEHQMQQEQPNVGAYQKPKHLYSTEVFDEIHRQLAPMHQRSTELGYLEYSDWQQYAAARDEWNRHQPESYNAAETSTGTKVLLGSTSTRRSN